MVRPRIVEVYGKIFYEYLPIWQDANEEEYILLNKLLEIVNIPISPNDQHLRNISRSIITLQQPIVVVLGAGFSYDRMPVTNELSPLLTSFLHDKGIESPAKLLQEDDKKVWELVKKEATKFKYMFAGRCASTGPAQQHKVIARMFHDGHISHVISFNWDNLIERAYADMYGEQIPKVTGNGISPDKPSLWKLHGDVEDLNSDWVFPYDNGRVLDNIMSSIISYTKKRPIHFALIIGYGEREKNVSEQLISPITKSVPSVLRVHPNWDARDNNGIQENAKTFLQRLEIYLQIENSKR